MDEEELNKELEDAAGGKTKSKKELTIEIPAYTRTFSLTSLRSLHLSRIQLIPQMASVLLESLIEVDCKQLIEIKFEHLDLSSKQNVSLLCNFLSI